MTFAAIPIVRPVVEKYGKKELAAVGMLIAACDVSSFILLAECKLNGILCTN